MPFQREKQSVDLTDEQWEVLEPLIPDPPSRIHLKEETDEADLGEILATS
jgi:transposase